MIYKGLSSSGFCELWALAPACPERLHLLHQLLLTKQLQCPDRGSSMSSQKHLVGQGLRGQCPRQRPALHISNCMRGLASIPKAVFARTLSWGQLAGCGGQQVSLGQRIGGCQSKLAELANKDLKMREAMSSGARIDRTGILISPQKWRQADTCKHPAPSNTRCMLSEKAQSWGRMQH